MTDVLKALKSANFLVDANGQRVAIQLSMAGQGNFARLIEKQEDAAIVKATIPKLEQLRSGSFSKEWLDWDAVKEEWDKD